MKANNIPAKREMILRVNGIKDDNKKEFINYNSKQNKKEENGSHSQAIAPRQNQLSPRTSYIKQYLYKYLSVFQEAKERCKGRVAQGIEHLLDAEEDAGSNFERKSRRAHTGSANNKKEIKQAHSLDKTPSRRRGISHEFCLDSEITETHTVEHISNNSYKNVSVFKNIISAGLVY